MVKKFQTKKNMQEGFTLVELVTVVLIIGILVAIATPLYNTIQEHIERTACQANLRTIDEAVIQWRAQNQTNSAVPNLETDIKGTFIKNPLFCPTTGADTYTLNSTTGYAECSNGHTY